MSHVLYAGVAQHVHPEVLEAITGEEPEVIVHGGTVRDAGLIEVGLADVPDTSVDGILPSVREVLEGTWGENFRALVLVRMLGVSSVPAMVYRISTQAFDHVREWQLESLGWQQMEGVDVRSAGHSGLRAQTEMPIISPSQRKPVGPYTNPFLNVDYKQTIQIARSIREAASRNAL